MRADLEAAFRFLRSSPGFTAAALLILTLGIGATTAIFSVVDAVVLRALPFDEHDRLVAIRERYSPEGQMSGDAGATEAIRSADPPNFLHGTTEPHVLHS